MACSLPVARATAAPPADLADLFPANTLAYAEVVNPAELAPQLAAVFRGTAMENSIALIHAKKDAAKTLMELNGKQHLAILGLLTSPEMLAEFKNIRIAGALTGFTSNGDPEFALVVLTNDSPAAGIAARAFVTMSTGLRKVAEVAKVPVFQYRAPNINYDNSGMPLVKNDTPFSDGPNEATFAYTPGLFVMGTSKTAIGHAIRRFVGEEKAEWLSSKPLFKEAAGKHRKTGLFYFVNFPEFTSQFSAANKQRGQDRGIADLIRPLTGGAEIEPLAWFNLIANAKAVKSISGSVRFRDGGLSASLAINFDANLKSPLFELLSGQEMKLEWLHHARGPAAYAVGVPFPEKNRADVVLGFLDSIAKANGELGRLPGEAVREWEQKFKVAVREELLGKTIGATVFLPKLQALPKGAKPIPMFVLHTQDPATAEAWAAFIPRMIGNLAGAPKDPQPSTETIDGVKVFSLPGTGLMWKAPVHYAQKGSTVAIGLDRTIVARAVTPEAAASVVGGAKAVSPPPEGVAAFGVVSIGDVLLGLLERPKPTGPVVAKEQPQVFLPNGNPAPASFTEELKKAEKDLVAAIGTLPLATLTAKRDGNTLQFELFQPKVQGGGLKSVIDAGTSWLDKAGSLMGMNRSGRSSGAYERW
ncbi:MAG TPA: hypothetical protein VLM40_09650 [Gemmata sp.]|nr:hypothetical protein [Gemmata sp.]